MIISFPQGSGSQVSRKIAILASPLATFRAFMANILNCISWNHVVLEFWFNSSITLVFRGPAWQRLTSQGHDIAQHANTKVHTTELIRRRRRRPFSRRSPTYCEQPARLLCATTGLRYYRNFAEGRQLISVPTSAANKYAFLRPTSAVLSYIYCIDWRTRHRYRWWGWRHESVDQSPRRGSVRRTPGGAVLALSGVTIIGSTCLTAARAVFIKRN